MSEQDEFLKDLDIDNKNDVLNQPLTEETTEPVKETEEESEFKAKNRRERRLLEKNQQLREEAIAATARLQGITEAQDLRKNTEEADYLKRVEKIYGNATPEAIEATNLLKEALTGVHESARKEAEENTVKRFEDERKGEDAATAKEEDTIEEGLERIEDEHNFSFTEADRQGFLTLLEKVSPKDSDGNIKEFADFDATYELYKSRTSSTNGRAKELASRSMTRSGSSQPSRLEDDATYRFLKENDII